MSPPETYLLESPKTQEREKYFPFAYLEKLRLPSTVYILLISALTTLFYNISLWNHVIDRFEKASFGAALFLGLLFLFASIPTTLVLLVLGNKYTLKPLIGFIILLSCVIAWFNHLGIIIDEDMVRNVLQTNYREATELLSGPFLLYLFFFGALPFYFISKVDVYHLSLPKELIYRGVSVLAFLLLVVILVISNYKFASYFGRENRELVYYVNPGYPIYSAQQYVSDTYSSTAPFVEIGLDAHQSVVKHKRTIGIMVVGETARADHFSLNGYHKETNPELAKLDVLNFSQASSCGTSTAYSVPCMFSFMDKKHYSPDRAKNQSNLLDVLEHAGVKTLWRDNNSSCKGVCARVENDNFRTDIDPDSEFYNDGEYIDEVLLSGLDERLQSVDSDMLIVMHQMGSHGPAYHRRYPEKFADFNPACESNSPQNCTDEEVSNSYDNTIRYTDHFLSQTIRFLKENEDEFDSFMIYASDHGESLGEEGVYLHGLPSSIAPVSQTHIPMLMWFSENLKRDRNLELANINECADKPVSHDNLVHSILTLFHIETRIKGSNQDLFSNGCS